MQALTASVCAAAGSAARAGSRRRAFAGRQLRAAVSNGSRCRAFFKFGNSKDKEANGAPQDAGAAGGPVSEPPRCRRRRRRQLSNLL